MIKTILAAIIIVSALAGAVNAADPAAFRSPKNASP